MSELMELADRCEAATEVDRELADEVLLSLGWRLNHDADEIAGWRTDPGTCEGEDGNDYPVTLADRMNWACWYKPGNRPFRDSWIDGNYRPNPLASIDAAMTLVPDNPYRTGERFQVEHWTTNGVHAAHVRASAWVSGTRRVFAATPALALCAAALRAAAALARATPAVERTLP